MDITTCRDTFLNYIQYEKRFSKHTLLAYANDLEQFYNYLSSTYEINSITEINHSIIRSWMVSLVEQKKPLISPRTINRKVTTLKTFYKYLLRQKLVIENPMLKIQAPKISKRLPVFVEKDNMNQLLNGQFEDSFEGKRDKLIIELFYATGIRLSELINLKQKDVDLYACQLKVLGKRNKERIIPFNDALKEEIKAYLEAKKDLSNEYLFIRVNGKKMYEKLVYELVKKYLSNVTSINKKSPHILRHTFATHMLNNGADINAIKELLGHSSLAATQVYTHNTVEKLKSIHKQAHPKA